MRAQFSEFKTSKRRCDQWHDPETGHPIGFDPSNPAGGRCKNGEFCKFRHTSPLHKLGQWKYSDEDDEWLNPRSGNQERGERKRTQECKRERIVAL